MTALPSAGQRDTTHYDARYFLRLLDTEGVKGIERRLYVAPPDLMGPLFSGIATGSPEWIKVYDGCRKGIDAVDRSGVTRAYLDDALGGALANAPERVLSYLRKHTEIPVRQICGRKPSSSDEADVLAPRELLEMVRRQRRVASVTGHGLGKQKAACLAEASERLRRQMRIYFVSFGASDFKAAGSRGLSATERRELDSAVAKARKDPSLVTQGHGVLPDGPFRTSAVPREVLAYCAKDLAEPEGPWEATDRIHDDELPTARLLSACQVTAEEWDLTCEQGGFSPYFQHVRARRTEGRWSLLEEHDNQDDADPAAAPIVLWPDCRSLSPSTAPARSPSDADGHR